MPFSRLVIKGRPPLQGVGYYVNRDNPVAAGIRPYGKGGSFHGIKGHPRVTVSNIHQVVQRIRRQRKFQFAQALSDILHGAGHNACDLLLGKGLQGKHPAAGQQGCINLKRRVLSGGPDEGNRAVLNMGQNHVLLGLVEPVNLVNEQDCSPLVHALPVPGLCHDTAQVCHAGGYGANRFEMGFSNCGHQAGQRSLAAARRAPQD